MGCDGIWVFIEPRAILSKGTREVLSGGRRLADKIGCKLIAVLAGYQVDVLIKEIAEFGADTVFVIDNPALAEYDSFTCCNVIGHLIQKYSPKAIFFEAGLTAHDLAPRLAAVIKTTLAANCELVETDENGRLKLSGPAYGGEVWVRLHAASDLPVLITMSPGAMQISRRKKDPDVIRLNDSDIPEMVVRHEGIIKARPESIDVTEAQVVIAGGRGLGLEGFTSLKKIAHMLGASIGGTRVAVDSGWIPYERQIGQTGKIVSPTLFVSLGASGAMHYSAGFKDSEFILAVDKNPRAAIFDIADVGAVADLRELLPALLNALNRRTQGKKEPLGSDGKI